MKEVVNCVENLFENVNEAYGTFDLKEKYYFFHLLCGQKRYTSI